MKALLTELNISQAAAARFFGVHRNTVARWCSGDCPVAVDLYLCELSANHKIALMDLDAADYGIKAVRDA